MRERVRRSLSWIGRAEEENEQSDLDAAFIFYWIALNAAYAEGRREAQHELEARNGYLDKITGLDTRQEVYNLIWKEFHGPIRILLDNEYVFQPFWDYHHGVPERENWEHWFKQSREGVYEALKEQNTRFILHTLFERLYTLRNQLMHGGATWNRSVNRDQVRDGTRIIKCLVPLFIDLMMDDPEGCWGSPYYPSKEILP
ncbi:MAG: hypothetical protein F4Y50_09970 [Dehalococcoidia bacterium]|nr:hypothetical protein [Dehalococcoidia bacterium]